MNKEVFKYLRSYSTNPDKVDRLIISAFLHSIKKTEVANELLSSYLIGEQDEDYSKLTEFLTLHKFSNFEELIEVFEFVISPEEKIVTGAAYTPEPVREYIVNEAFSNSEGLENILLCDPACGCAGFLFTAAKKIKEKAHLTYQEIFSRNLYGLDIQEFSITRSKLLLALLAISEGEDIQNFNYNLFEGNALSFDWNSYVEIFEGFDIIVGNPPYVCSRNIDEESKKHLTNWSVCSSGHPDLYIPFFQIGLENLKERGKLGYITMNSFFKSLNGRALRDYLQVGSFDFRIIDFGGKQVFQSNSTYSCICLIEKQSSEHLKYIKLQDTNLNKIKLFYGKINYSSLNAYAGWNLSNIDVINQIEQTGTPFGDLYRTRNGIATLKNGIYIFNPVGEDNEFYYLQNGQTYQIEKQVCKDIINPNKLTRIDNVEALKKKIIFPYTFEDNNSASLITEEQFRDEYPNAFAYLLERRAILAERDKGKGEYENWFAYGRNQSLERFNNKLFFPHITPTIPNYVINQDEELLFYNGMAVVSDSERELQFLKKLMSSRLFWYYIINSSKPYGSGYFSMSRNYIKNFGIYPFTDEEKEFICNENNQEIIDEFIAGKYGIEISFT